MTSDSTTPTWLHIPKWEEFQYRSDKELPWIKFYVRLTGQDKWLDLTYEQRGILTSLWLEYARENRGNKSATLRGLNGTTAALYRRCGQRVTSRQLERLEKDDWIAFSADRERPVVRTEVALEGDREREESTPLKGALSLDTSVVSEAESDSKKESDQPDVWNEEKHEYEPPPPKSKKKELPVPDELQRRKNLVGLAELMVETLRVEYAGNPNLSSIIESTIRESYPEVADRVLKEAS